MTDEQIEKLPKRARDYIKGLRAALADREKTIETLINAPPPEGAALAWNDRGLTAALPDRAEVRFKTAQGQIAVSFRNGLVRVAGLYSLSVKPQAANVILVDDEI